MLTNMFQIKLGCIPDNIQPGEKTLINLIRERVERNSAAFPSSMPWKVGAAQQCVSHQPGRRRPCRGWWTAAKLS